MTITGWRGNVWFARRAETACVGARSRRYEPPEVTWGGAAAGVGTEFAGALFELELPELELLEPEPASSPEEAAGDDELEAPVGEAPLLVTAE